MAKVLGIRQDGVSKLEKRSDLLFSNQRKTVAAIGGRTPPGRRLPRSPTGRLLRDCCGGASATRAEASPTVSAQGDLVIPRLHYFVLDELRKWLHDIELDKIAECSKGGACTRLARETDNDRI
jgi:hypothetical protein